ncbi:TIGR00266 family protein [Butyrivibrio sp. MC2013]|uniref:TIGR00266 family protein n=1 Tax=Butyrivibrio sp. MC2013 TaxID=1280686 RepID=UPI00041A6B9E|nr:TIGR00266 family protein [Butyrivibrio sp. MC2013]
MQYQISNQPFTVVTLQMSAGESIKCQSGAMAWMSRGIRMETKTGGLGGIFKKAIVGESIALNHYIADQPGELTLAKHSPGDIVAFDVTTMPVIAQKTSFLASNDNVNIDIFLQHKAGAGFFGGEGFLMQKFSGQGIVFLEIDGAVQERQLGPGEQLVIDSGYVAAMEASCSMSIETVKGLTNIVLGGEGLFNTVVTGPGRVWLQTMPINQLAMNLYSYMPHPRSN